MFWSVIISSSLRYTRPRFLLKKGVMDPAREVFWKLANCSAMETFRVFSCTWLDR